MEEHPHEDVISMVNSMFDVSDFTKAEFSLEFRIEDPEFKSKFEDLARRMEPMGYACRMEELDDGTRHIIVQKFVPPKRRRWLGSSWAPRMLFGVVVAFVMIDGYYRTSFANAVIHIGDPVEMAALYTAALLGILGVHELGHIVAAKAHRLRTTWPYFLPGIPVYGIPTFGAFIQSKGLTINREILYDVAIAGPIAGLAVAVIVSVYGAYYAPVLDEAMVGSDMFSESGIVLSDWNLGEPLLMTASLAVFEKGSWHDQQILMTPFMFAAWVGFLVTFLNLLPAWQLDGGHMARTLIGARLHRYTTYGSIGVLVLLNFWPMALLILIMGGRNPSATPLDDISPLSRNRKLSYVGIVALAAICAPLPTDLVPTFLS